VVNPVYAVIALIVVFFVFFTIYSVMGEPLNTVLSSVGEVAEGTGAEGHISNLKWVWGVAGIVLIAVPVVWFLLYLHSRERGYYWGEQ
jgi:phosphoglycerol transferase MdoB-like AlkP superfamily enzyme